MDLMLFQPIWQERVWGGRRLETFLNRSLPEGKVIGESWEVVDRDEAVSVVTSGRMAGWSLRKALSEYPEAIMGPGWPSDRRFPILVKWLDCQERLSLQVHPPASVAPELGGEPKTENWYVAAATQEAALMVGLKPGVTREAFEEGIRTNELEPLVHRIPVRDGQSMFVPSGRIHAIDAGCIILEIQQNSDTTYRVYDWGRMGLDGKPRELHVDQSLASIDFEDSAPDPIDPMPGEQLLVDAPEFRLRKIDLKPSDAELQFPASEEPRLIHIVSGSLQETRHNQGLIMPGDSALLPYAEKFAFAAVEKTRLLITDRFIKTV